jgi:hypothetical protein
MPSGWAENKASGMLFDSPCCWEVFTVGPEWHLLNAVKLPLPRQLLLHCTTTVHPVHMLTPLTYIPVGIKVTKTAFIDGN